MGLAVWTLTLEPVFSYDYGRSSFEPGQMGRDARGSERSHLDQVPCMYMIQTPP